MNFLKSNKLVAVQIFGVSVIALLFAFSYLIFGSGTQPIKPPTKEKTKEFKIELPSTPVTSPAPIFKPPPHPPEIIRIVKARAGDTFMKLLIKGGADRTSAHNAIRAMAKVYKPRNLKRGQKIYVAMQPKFWGVKTGPFVGYRFNPTAEKSIRVRRSDSGRFKVKKTTLLLDRKDTRFTGSIRSSLYVAATKAGMPASSLANVIRLFSWDVDFQRDIKRNDKFDILLEKLHQKNGDFARWGNILYAKLTLSGKPLRLYRHKSKRHGVGYFDERGRSAQKALMKTPINGARLSSGYGLRRHPILGYNKVHRGVDFAAPRGTPIYAAGNGIVTYAGRKGAYGKYIKIRHNGRFSTAYAHLRGFKRGIRRGRRVTQGQTIGYVGSTGRSTGPHLHYEIHVNGRKINPLRLKLPSGRKLKGAELRNFIIKSSDKENRLTQADGALKTRNTNP